MLTREDKYKLCPAFNHIINRTPIVGDYILSYEGLYIVQELFDSEELDEGTIETYIRCYNLFDEKYRSQYYCDYSSIFSIKSDTYLILDNEFAELIANNVNYNEFYKITDVIISQDRNYGDYPQIYYIYMVLYRLYTYIKSLVTDDMDKMILLSFGVKKVLKKHKNNGFRDVLLGNGQVWRLHKEKKKGMLRKKIARRNRYISDNKIPNKRKMKTVHYTIIKLIS